MRPRFYWWPFLAVCALAGWALLAPLLALAQVGPLPVVGKWGIIGRATVDVNTVGDTIIPMTGPTPTYEVGGANVTASTSVFFWIGACSGTFTTFQGVLYTGAGGTGTALTAVGTFSAAAPTTFTQKAGNILSTLIFTRATQPALYFRVTTPQGAAGTCQIWVTGADLPP